MGLGSKLTKSKTASCFIFLKLLKNFALNLCPNFELEISDMIITNGSFPSECGSRASMRSGPGACTIELSKSVILLLVFRMKLF